MGLAGHGRIVSQTAGMNMCIIDDFNSILKAGEMVGSGWRISSREIHKFRDFMVGNRLVDVGYKAGNLLGTCVARARAALIEPCSMRSGLNDISRLGFGGDLSRIIVLSFSNLLSRIGGLRFFISSRLGLLILISKRSW